MLEGAHLETVKFGKGFGILNVDEHAGILRSYSGAKIYPSKGRTLIKADGKVSRNFF